MERYMPRLIDRNIEEELKVICATAICGPRGCGKTASAMRHCRSALHLEDPASAEQNSNMSVTDPARLLKGETPRLIEEWQLFPVMWDTVRCEADRRCGEPGQFIMTSSAAPRPDAKIHHSGAGRIGRVQMEPMTLYESGDSDGSVSLEDLLYGAEDVHGTRSLDPERLAFLVCRGGWPSSVGKSGDAALLEAHEYYDGLAEKRLTEADGVKRSPDRVRSFFRAYSRAIGTQAGKPQLADDMKGHDGVSVNPGTMDSYMNALKRTYTAADTEAWTPRLTTKDTVCSAPTREFTDPSVAAAALDLGPKDLINNPGLFNTLFRSMCVRDLRVYARSISSICAGLYHYRDSTGLEAEIVELTHGMHDLWGAIIADLGITDTEELAARLLKLKGRVFTDGEHTCRPEASFLMVLSGLARRAYRRPDGVLVVPVGCLRP